MEEAVNAFKRSLAEVSSIGGDLKRAISNIEKTSLEQVKKQGNAKNNNNSSSNEKSVRTTKSVNQPITNVKQAEALGRQFAHLYQGKVGYEGLSLEETANKLTRDILESGKQKRVTKIEFGHGKEPQTQEKSDKDYDIGSLKMRQRGYRLVGEEKAEAIIASLSKADTDRHGNNQFQPDFSATHLAFDNIEYEQKKQKEEEIKREKEERKREKEETKREKLLKEYRDEFKYTEKEIQNEERQQVIALKEKQQLQLGVSNDLIQGGAGMAMGVALNKPTIIFASLATSAAKVTSRFGMLGKAIAGVISVLSAVGAVANVLTGRTNDNILKGAKSHISPETANAIKSVGSNLLGDPDALMGSVNNITDLKATISNPVGFSQQLARISSSGAGAILAKHGMNPLDILNKINTSTTEEAMTWLGEKFLPKFKNSNEALEVAKTLGIADLLNANIQLKTTFGKDTGIMQEVREVKESAGQLTAETKAQQYKTGKEGAIAGAKWGINNITASAFGSAVEGFWKAVSKFSDAVAGGKGNNTKQLDAMSNLRNGKIKSLADMQTLVENSQFTDGSDIFKLFLNADLERETTMAEWAKLKPLQDRARTLQQEIQHLPKKQQESMQAKFLNENFVKNHILAKSTGENVAQGVRYEDNASVKTTNVNLIVTDKTQNGIRAHHAGGE